MVAIGHRLTPPVDVFISQYISAEPGVMTSRNGANAKKYRIFIKGPPKEGYEGAEGISPSHAAMLMNIITTAIRIATPMIL